MKKLFLIAAVILTLSACKLDDNPAYYTLPEISDVFYTPELDWVTVNDEVTVQANIRNEHGTAQACILYQVGNDLVSARAAQIQTTEIVTIPNKALTPFSAVIPKQAEGKWVIFSVYCLSAYGVNAYSDQYVYTVLSEFGNIDYSSIVLNEIDGNRQFIEIHNKGVEDINLGRCTLRLNENTTIWIAPENTELRSGAYLTLDGKENATTADYAAHFTGSIYADRNIAVSLINADGKTIDTFQRGTKGNAGWGATALSLQSDYSFSRCPNGNGNWAYAAPSKGAYNNEKAADIEHEAAKE